MLKKAKKPLSLSQKRDLLVTSITAIKTGEALSDSEKAVAIEALTAHLSFAESAIRRAAILSEKIANLRFGTDALREILLLQCDRLAMVESEEGQDKIIDTLLSALRSKPPDPPKQAQRKGDVRIGDGVMPSRGTGEYDDVEV